MKNLNELPEILRDLRSNGLLRNQSVRCVPTCEKKDSRRSNCWADIQYRKHR